MANCVPPAVVRIDGEEWVLPLEVSFRTVLVSWRQKRPHASEPHARDNQNLCSTENVTGLAILDLQFVLVIGIMYLVFSRYNFGVLIVGTCIFTYQRFIELLFTQDVLAQVMPALNPLPTAFECEPF